MINIRKVENDIMKENNTFTIINNEGKKILYEIVCIFESDETNKSYIIYTDNTMNDKGKLKMYGSTYILKENMMELKPVESNKEMEIINNTINDIYDRVCK